MAKSNSVNKLIASVLCANMIVANAPTAVIATEISNITGNNGVYNIEASKVSGSTGFRTYEKFNLDKGDVANLIYKLDNKDFSNFVNLVDDKVVINGLLNTMRDNNFFNGHAIFVSPNGVVVGASGVLNVGSLTMMAPSQNAYNAFKKGLTDNDYKNMSSYEFDVVNGNYKSLITNSSGTIEINGKVFARENVNLYARSINVQKEQEEKEINGIKIKVTKADAPEPGIFAGIQGNDKAITEDEAADALFKELVSNNITNFDNFNLKDGKIALITNSANDEIISTVTYSEENGQKIAETTTINVTNGLKTVEKAPVKDDVKDSEKTTTYSVDTKTYEKSSLEADISSVTISNANIAANEVSIETNDSQVKKVTDDTIKQYGEALAKSNTDNNKSDDNKSGNTDSNNNTNNGSENKNSNNNNTNSLLSINSSNDTNNNSGNTSSDSSSNNDSSNAGSDNNKNNGSDSTKNNTDEDKTTGFKIHKSDKGTAPSAMSMISVTNSKISGDKISIKANAKSSTETKIQLLTPIYETWIEKFGSDLVLRILAKMDDSVAETINTDEWQAWNSIKNYFSDKAYTDFQGGNASASITISNSDFMAKDSIDIISSADAVTKISTGKLDSHPLFLYGLGSQAKSFVNIRNSKLKTSEDDSSININALSTIVNNIDYDSSNFISFVNKKDSSSGDSDKKDDNTDNKTDNNNNNTDNNSDNSNSNLKSNNTNNSDSDKNSGNTDNNTDNNNNNSDNNKDGNSDNNKDTDNNKNNDDEKGKVSAYNLTLLNNSIISDTGVTIDNSTIEAANVNVRAISFNQSETSVKNVSNVGKDSTKTGIAAGMIINHTDTKSNVNIKNGTQITANYRDAVPKKDDDGNVVKDSDGNEVKITYGNAKIIAQNINQIKNSVKSEVKAKDQEYEIKSKDLSSFDPSYSIKIYEWLNKKFLSKLTDKLETGLDKLSVEFSGSGIWNSEVNISNAIVDNSKINAASVDISSNIVDYTINSTEANAGADNKFSAGAAVIVNEQANTSLADVKNQSVITSSNEVKVNATTQLPMSPMELKIGQEVGDGNDKKELYLGVGFDQGDGIASWDAEFLHTKLKDLLDLDTIKNVGAALKKPKNFVGENELSMDGLFNNLAKAEGSGNTAAIAGSVVVNSIANNTTASINGAEIIMTGNVQGKDVNRALTVNSSNSVVNYNGAGKVDFLIEEINEYIGKLKDKKDKTEDEKEAASKVGLGGSVMVNNFTNNATSKIDNAKIKIENGDLNVLSASEEGYINVLVTGATADKFVLEGSVNVQNVDGTTSSYIVNSDEISASNVNVNAGKALIKTKKSGDDDPIELDDDTKELSVNDERDVEDKLLSVNILGVNATQKSDAGSGSTSSSGASVGVSVNVGSVSKKADAYIDNSTINADEAVTVNADTLSRKVDVLLAAASAGGVDIKEAKEEAKENKENKDKQEDKDKQDSTQKESKNKNVGNWMDMLDEAGDDEEDVMNLRDLFDENNASEKANETVKENKDTIKTSDKNVDKDGKESTSKNDNAKDGDKSNTEVLTDNNNKKIEGDNNKSANTETASDNFSLAAAGAINITKDETKTTAKITNSNINSGKKTEVKSDYDTLVVDVNGGFAKAGNVATGAGVNVYRNLSETNSLVEKSTINFTDKAADSLSITSNADIDLIDVTAGIGAATNTEDKTKVAVGGSFGWNTLKNKVSSKMNETTVKKAEEANNPKVKVEAADDSYIWNITGGVAYAGSTGNSTGIGAGIASTVNYSSKEITSEITDSTLTDVSDVKVNANLKQDYNTIAIAAALATGAQSSYTFDGAVNTEVNTNVVTARGKDSTIISSGAVDITANDEVKNKSLAGGLEFSTSSNGGGVGIGAIVNVNNSHVTAEADKLNVQESGSIKINAQESEELYFLAANFGIQTSGGNAITVNGIANVFVSDVLAQAVNNSVLNSTGGVGIDSVYNNSLNGIVAGFAGSMSGLTFGANIIADVYNNKITSLLEKGSKISAGGDVKVNARAKEIINLIPVGVAMSNGGSSIAANINANVFVDTVKSQLFGEIEKSGSVFVNAQDMTSIISRGGTLELSNSGSSVGGNINVDVLDKTIISEINNTNVKSDGKVEVVASGVNAFGGTENSNGYYDAATIDDAKKYTEKDNGKYKDAESDKNFANWNMFYDLGASFQASVSGAIVVKVIDDEVRASVINSTIDSNALNVEAKDYTVANAIIGRISYGGEASVGANVFVLAGKSDVDAEVKDGSVLNVNNLASVKANSKKESTLITVGGSAAGTASVNGSAVANVINDEVTAKIYDGVTVNTGSLDVIATSNNDIKGLLVNASLASTAAVGAVAYINKQNTATTAQIGDKNSSNQAIINAKNNITVSSTSDDEFEALLVNVAASGTAGIAAMGLLNFIDSDVKSGVYNSTVTSEQGKVDVIADRGFNRGAAESENKFRSWFKGTSAYKKEDNDKKAGTITEKDIAALTPNVGVLGVAASGTVSVSANVISNDIEGNVTAEVKDSTVSSDKGLNVKAQQDFTNFDTIASVSASGNAAVNLVGEINLLEDNITAQLDNTKVTKGGANVEAKSVMDLNQVIFAGQGAGVGAGVGLVLDMNKINDKVHAYVTNGSEIHDGTSVSAQHAIEINNILVSLTIAGTGAAVTAIPILNTYSGETIAQINGNSIVNDGDINVNAADYVDNFSAVAAASGAGLGASVGGFLIRNNYENTVDASINNLVLNTNNNVNISSSSLVDSENALLTLGFGGIGVSLLANVIINDFESTVKSYIDNTDIEKAGNIVLTANKDKQDNIYNLAGSVSVTGVGAAASVNSAFNLYENTTRAYVDNTSIENADSLTLKAYGKRDIDTLAIGATGNGIGAAIAVNAIVNEVDADVAAYVDAKDKTINIDGDLNVLAESKTTASNSSGIASISGGVAVGANIGLHDYNDVAKAEILSGSDGSIKANNANLSANSTYGLKNETVVVTAGSGAIAGDVTIINMGKRTDVYSSSENQAKVGDAIDEAGNVYKKVSDDNKFNPTSSGDAETGAIATSNANLTTNNDINISASGTLQGKDGGVLTLSNEVYQAGGISANVGVKIVKLANNTIARIAGGKVKSESGNVNLSANSDTNVKIKSISANVSGASVSGSVGIYKNNALTQAIVNDTVLNANAVNIAARSSNKSVIDDVSYVVSFYNLGVSILDNRDENYTYALISGDNNITANSLNLHATGNTELNSSLRTKQVSGVNISYLENDAHASSITKAMIENATGEINVDGLNIIADTSKMSVTSGTNFTGGSLVTVSASESGAYMNAELTAGINTPTNTDENAKNLVINNSGRTTIIAGVDANDNSKAADIAANAELENFSVGVVSGSAAKAKAYNNVKVNAKLIANEHNADSAYVKATMNEIATATIDSDNYGGITVSDSGIMAYADAVLGIDVSGKNTIKNNIDLIANNNAATDVNMMSSSGGALNIGVTDIYSNLNSNTTLNVGGELNAENVNITADTQRYSKVDYSSCGAGAITISSGDVNNNVRGTSTINLTNYKSSGEKSNKITVINNSTNTQDTVSSSISAGAVAIGSASVGGTFDSSSVINVKDSEINTKNNVKNTDDKDSSSEKATNDFNLEVNTTNIVKDTSSSTNGGIVAITKNNVTHNYSSGSQIVIDNSKITADNVNLKANAEVKNAREDDWVNYRGSSGGFIAKNETNLKNYISQTSSINTINKSDIHSRNNATLTTQTGSAFKQKIDSSGSGFVAIPKGNTTLSVTNNNNIYVEKDSVINADNSAILNFDSSNTLAARAYSNAAHFAGEPSAKSYLTLNINNTLNDNGEINAGKLVDVNYMNNSYNNLTQYARTEADAAVATSAQGGYLSRAVNNLLQVGVDGKISSKKDVNISYNGGKEDLSSEISYRSTSYALLGIPITVRGSWSSIFKNTDHKMQLDGIIIAGEGNNKYMKISSDGKIEFSKGFDSDSYKLSDDIVDGDESLKDRIIKILEERISELNAQIEELQGSIDAKDSIIKFANDLIEENNDKLAELGQYTAKSLDEFEEIGNDDYKALVRQALINNGDVEKDKNGNVTKVTVDYETIANDYIAYVKDMRVKIEEANDKYHTDGTAPAISESDIMTMGQFIDSKDTATYTKLSDKQKTILTQYREIVEDKITQTKKGNYNVYDNTYVLMPSITYVDEAGDKSVKSINEDAALAELNKALQEIIELCKKDKDSDNIALLALKKNKTMQEDNKAAIEIAKDGENAVPYYIEFADMASEASGIYISGGIDTDNKITGSGKFSVESPALTVDNYSTRSLIFNSIVFGSEETDGLIINGIGYGDYLNRTDKVIGKNTGIHYVSSGIGGNGDITITNVYDILNPFASSLDVPNNTQASDIVMQKAVLTGGRMNIYNESGDITALSSIDSGSKNYVSVNGNIYIMPEQSFTLKEDDNIFAGDYLRITANEADLKGNITAGYEDRNITITDDMLAEENLIIDPTTGEKNMINLNLHKPNNQNQNQGQNNSNQNQGSGIITQDGNTITEKDICANKFEEQLSFYKNKDNNIKAIYKDGQIYVFGTKDSRGVVNLEVKDGTVTSNVTTKSSGIAINIDNKTDKTLNVSKITNISDFGGLHTSGGADFSGVQHTALTTKPEDAVLTVNSNGGINFNSEVSHLNDINITNKDGDITIFNTVSSQEGDLTISQNNGDVLNGIVDDVDGAEHSNVDTGAQNDKYKQLLGTTQNLIIDVVDGSIGAYTGNDAKIGIDASTRDYTDSINVSVGGTVTATAKNNTTSDKRVINLRGYYSDLNINEITSEGDVILTAADWYASDDITAADEYYYDGFSIQSAVNGAAINGQNVSLISSGNIGSDDNRMIVNQDSSNGAVKISMEAEKDIITGIQSNTANPTYIDAIVSKQGNVDLVNSTSSVINQITSGGHLHILETGKELTIYNIGGVNSNGGSDFKDMLYPHDNIALSADNIEAAIPDSIAIEVLDAFGGDNAESTLKIYSAYVNGRNGGDGEFDSNGRQIADVSLMADNVYVNSANAKNSYMPTVKNSGGYQHTDDTYTDSDLGLLGDTVYQAQGINTHGDGKAIVVDVKGVSKEFVEENSAAPNRTNYKVQTPVAHDSKFDNPNNQITDYDYRANNVVVSVNNNSSTDRGVVINAIYADDAYVDTNNSDLSVKDGYIQNFAEFSNVNKKITVDNDFRRRVTDADTQIYTAKTGSFALDLKQNINMKTTAPVVGNDFDKLTNNYQSEGNFVNKSRKDSTNLNDNINRYNALAGLDYHEELKRVSMRFDTTNDSNLRSNFKIYDLSATGALIKNTSNLKVGDYANLRLAFDDMDVTLKSKVVSLQGDKAGLEFINIPPYVANKILYRYMQQVEALKQKIRTSSL